MANRRRLFPAAVVLATLTLGACDTEPQPLPEDKKEYAGAWAGQDMKLVIEPEGRIEYERGSKTITAPIQSYDGDDFTVGAFGLSTTFDVQEVPHRAEDGLWRMKVDGVDLVRMDVEKLLGKLNEAET